MDAADDSKPVFASRASRKPFRQSGLRKTFNTDDDESAGTSGDAAPNDDTEEGPAVVRPAVSSRPTSFKQKARIKAKSKLSFGGDAGDPSEDAGDATGKHTLGKRAVEKNAFAKGLGNRGLPVRSIQEDEERPRYSKEYLAELQSTTPNTPQDVTSLTIDDADEMELDASELEGALVVDMPKAQVAQPDTTILSEAEIKERKERRKRLAQEEDFLSMEDDNDDPFRRKKEESRLKADEDELGEGFDDYVEDGGLSLGKRAMKERTKRERQQMAELISTAEGNESESSADSDAERRIAYEAAQTRAGMEGLKKPKTDPRGERAQIPPKITPLPVFSECVSRLQGSLTAMQLELQNKMARVQQLRDEKEEIVKREAEVQALLDEAGRKYQEAMGQGKVWNGAASEATLTNPALMGARGLESLGTTPRRVDGEDDEVV